MGLRRGALLQLQAGLIDETTFATINQMIETATISDFRPLIYIIPRALVEKKLRRVPVDQTANPFSVEFQILDLEKTEFEIIYI